MSAPIDAQEIREALEAHAQFDDTAALARLGSVKARVRVVRRRRRAALAGAAAAVVAVVGGVATLLPGEREAVPSDRTFGDLTAPATMTSLGYTYTFDRLVTGEGEARFADTLDTPALVTWASLGDTPAIVTQTVDSEDSLTSQDDFADFIALDREADQAVQVVGKGKVALAVYTLTGRPAGVTKDGVTFREDRSGDRLVTAEIGDRGQNRVEATFTMPARPLVVADFCAGVGRGYNASMLLNGSWIGGGECGDEPTFDGEGSRVTYSEGLGAQGEDPIKPGERVTLEVVLTAQGFEGPAAAHDDVRLGLALYEQAPPVAHVPGFGLPELYEYAGHVYRFVETPAAERVGAGWGIRADVPAAGAPRLVVYSSVARGLVRLFVDGGEGTAHESEVGGAFRSEVGPLSSGEHTVALRGRQVTSADQVGFAVYERVD